MSKHTPGPWRVDDSVFSMTGGELWILAKGKDGEDVSIAAVRPGCEEAEEVGDNAANARLIAIAPALLTALRQRSIVQHVRMTHGGGHVKSGQSCALCNAEWGDVDDPGTETHAEFCLLANTATPEGTSPNPILGL